MKFQVKALQGADAVVSLVLEAADPADAIRQAQASGLAVLSLRRCVGWHLPSTGRKTRFPLVLFSQELLALLEAGLTLVEAIDGLAEKETRGPIHATLDYLRDHLNQGHALSQAMQDLPREFPELFVAAVRATERTGNLADALRRYVAYEVQLEAVRKKIVSASIYPVLLLVVGGLVLFFLLGYVVPKFSHVYENIQGNLPLLSRILLGIGQFLEANMIMTAAALLAATLAVIRLTTSQHVRSWIGGRLWRLPAIGERMRLYQLARFYRTLGMLLRGGIPFVSALEMSAGLLSPALRHSLAIASNAIREGEGIAESLSRNNLTTAVAVRMLRVGERSGRMDEMMDRIASFYDEEISRWVDWFTRLFEPLLMAFIGVLIGTIVVLMYLPVFELAGSIQ